ncbi:MAG: transcriptional repressor LexA [Nitrospirales bacterium]|nr:transcriptional repressor LexA [Nitrospirales bacterium]
MYERTPIVDAMTIERHFNSITAFYHARGRMPSYQEIADLARFRSKTAAVKLVSRLIDLGRVGKDRTGRLLPTKYFHEIRWLGSVVAGYPSPAEEELIDVLSLEEFLIKNKEATYMLKVQGDSMIDEGIRPGDIVLVERKEQARNGDIVVAQVDGEWTLKRYVKKGKQVRLEAANKKYPPIVPKEELRIAAVVCGLVRKY